MLRPTGLWLALKPIDLRCGMDRLLVLVQTQFGRDGFDGGAYLFRNRSGSRLKIVCADAQGVWLCTRRLHRGQFTWPRAGEAMFAISAAQFEWLIAGVDWQRLSARIEDVPRLL
ncbi:MAG TPA: IS66 family insertion sequence element accessory protein TnpB [Xanthomonadales bacterium]|nr:IS66 family insertion sequence element accessory protein TnpB [Xanthomonadales bacterium]